MAALTPCNADVVPGPHPLGAAVGALGAAFAGAVVGWTWGPLGVAVGALVAALGGGLAGYGFGEAALPYEVEPLLGREGAFQHSWEQYARYKGRTSADVRPDIGPEWDDLEPATRDGR
jgi:hypothetical protein